MSMRAFGCLMVGLILVACGGGGQGRSSRDSQRFSAGPAAPPTKTTTPAGNAPCAANGQWSDCAVFQALDRAGLAPRRDSAAGVVSLPPLSQSGARLLLGGSELDFFVYPDARARERDEARLDRSKFIEATDEPTLRGEATIIRNVNLLAILRSRNDHQRERVSDAFSAGPLQAAGSRTTLPSTHVPK